MAYHPAPSPVTARSGAAQRGGSGAGGPGSRRWPLVYGRVSAIALSVVALLAFAIAMILTLVMSRPSPPPVLHVTLIPPAIMHGGPR